VFKVKNKTSLKSEFFKRRDKVVHLYLIYCIKHCFSFVSLKIFKTGIASEEYLIVVALLKGFYNSKLFFGYYFKKIKEINI